MFNSAQLLALSFCSAYIPSFIYKFGYFPLFRGYCSPYLLCTISIRYNIKL